MLSEETRQELFDLAYRYRRTRLWKKLRDQQLFAVALPEGETAYCCVMGMDDQHVALGVYVGQQGFASYFRMLDTAAPDPADDDGYFSYLPALEQDCMQCYYDDGEYMTPEEVDQARQAARQLHIKLKPPLRYPCFSRMRPMRRPGPLEDEKEAEIMAVCLRAAICVNGLLEDRKISIPFTYRPGRPLPLLTETAPGKFRVSADATPASVDIQVPRPSPLDEFTLTRLKKCRADGTWICALYIFVNGSSEDDPMALPAGPVAINADTQMAVPATPIRNYEGNPDGLFREFVSGLINLKTRPSKVVVHSCDLRGQAFFGTLADQLGIPFETSDSLPELEEVLDGLAAMSKRPEITDAQMDELIRTMCEMILQTPLPQLCEMPDDIQNLAASLLNTDHPAVTREVRDKVSRLIDMRN